MDSSQLTRYRQRQHLTAYYERQNRRGPQDQMLLREGAGPLIQNARQIIPSIVPILPDDSTPARRPTQLDILDTILRSFDIFLQWTIAKGNGPTVTARAIYLWSMASTTAWSWIRSDQLPLSGTHDEWNWNLHSASALSTRDAYIWMNHALADRMAEVFPTMDTTSILAQERAFFGWSIEEQLVQFADVQIRGEWNTYMSKWNTWLSSRSADESTTALTTQPTTGQVPNIASEIQTDSATFPTLPDPATWTPLKIPSKTRQTYLTYLWGSVRSTGITEAMETAINAVADSYYITGSARDTEVDDVVTLTGTLTDEQKVMAEFWAGGPGTVTPPGMMGWLWKETVRVLTPSVTKTLFSGLDLGIHLFEGARLTWANKARKNQARPIQEIRRRRGGETLTSWNGESIQGSLWTPYQEIDFVSPPFPDFPSGHSNFSQVFANTMTAWFGEQIPTTTTDKTDLSVLSPAFQDTASQTGPIGEIVFPAGKSQIQAGVVPATAVRLIWTTWQDMADSAGMSRLYGGIHCLSAHTSSQAIANELHTQLETVWGFQRV